MAVRGVRLTAGASILLLALAALGYWAFSTAPCEFESTAVADLRAISYAQTEYEQTHPDEGYAAAFIDLRSAELISEALATGADHSYLFTLAPGTRQSGRIITYGIVAQPSFDVRTSCPSFFTDESGVIRFTREDRAATAAAPQLQ